MRIDPTVTYAGVPALDVRDLLGKVRVGLFTDDIISRRLRLDPGGVRVVLGALLRAGFIRAVDKTPRDVRTWYTITPAGRRYSTATPHTFARAAADRALAVLEARIDDVNTDAASAYRVLGHTVHGSYAETTLDRVGTVHVRVMIAPRTTGSAASTDAAGTSATGARTLVRRLQRRSRILRVHAHVAGEEAAVHAAGGPSTSPLRTAAHPGPPGPAPTAGAAGVAGAAGSVEPSMDPRAVLRAAAESGWSPEPAATYDALGAAGRDALLRDATDWLVTARKHSR